MTVQDCSHIFWFEKRGGLHYSDFLDRPPVFMWLGRRHRLDRPENHEKIASVEKVGLTHGFMPGNDFACAVDVTPGVLEPGIFAFVTVVVSLGNGRELS